MEANTSQLPPLVRAYRAAHPESRAIREWTLTASGSVVRRATCIFCRTVIATCAAKWPATQAFAKLISEHQCVERELYMQRADTQEVTT